MAKKITKPTVIRSSIVMVTAKGISFCCIVSDTLGRRKSGDSEINTQEA